MAVVQAGDLNFDVLSTKMKPLLVFRGKLYSKSNEKRRSDTITKFYWMCTCRNCSGSVQYEIDDDVEEDGGVMNIVIHDHSDSCTTSAADVGVAKARAEIMAQADLGTPLQTAYADTMNRLRQNEPATANLVIPILLQRQLQSAYSRKFTANLPVLPPPGQIENLVIPPGNEYRFTNDGQNFLMFQESFPNVPGQNQPNDCSILAFCSEAFFLLLCSANRFFLDGTFNVCPPQYHQYFTINVFHGNNRRLILCLHVLLTRKTQNIYVRLFQLIRQRAQQLNIPIQWTGSMSDYESGLLAALQTTFNNNFDIQGCHFHMDSAVYKNVLEGGLRVSYNGHALNLNLIFDVLQSKIFTIKFTLFFKVSHSM